MNLLITEYFLSGKTPQDLEAEYGVGHRWHPRYPNLLLVKYSQIDSPMGEKIVQECRGLILDRDNGFRPVNRPFGKFFNYGEGHAEDIDWGTARVQEKMDGSLCTIWFYQGEWHVSTTGSPDAGGGVGDFPFSFRELFWRTFQELGYEVPREHERDLCFMFELTSKYNRIVVVHDQPALTLLAVRSRVDGSELDPNLFQGRYKVVQHFPLSSFKEVLGTFPSLDPIRQEGYVVVDGNFNRVKVKHPGYVALHHLKEGATTKNFLEIIRSGETEFLTYFPEWTEEFTAVRNSYTELVLHLETEYERIKGIPVQKDFALEAGKTRHPGTLFNIRRGYVKTVRESLAICPINALMAVLGLKEQNKEQKQGKTEE